MYPDYVGVIEEFHGAYLHFHLQKISANQQTLPGPPSTAIQFSHAWNKISTARRARAHLVHEVVPEHRLPVDDLHGDGSAGLDVGGEPDLGEGALADGPAEPVLADAPRGFDEPHLPVALDACSLTCLPAGATHLTLNDAARVPAALDACEGSQCGACVCSNC